MLLSAMSVLVIAQSSSEIREGLMNNPVLKRMVQKHKICFSVLQSVIGDAMLHSVAVISVFKTP